MWGSFKIYFFCLIHPDEVQCSRNARIECGDLFSFRTEEWDDLYIGDNRKHCHCPDLACATHLGFHQGHDPRLEERD